MAKKYPSLDDLLKQDTATTMQKKRSKAPSLDELLKQDPSTIKSKSPKSYGERAEVRELLDEHKQKLSEQKASGKVGTGYPSVYSKEYTDFLDQEKSTFKQLQPEKDFSKDVSLVYSPQERERQGEQLRKQDEMQRFDQFKAGQDTTFKMPSLDVPEYDDIEIKLSQYLDSEPLKPESKQKYIDSYKRHKASGLSTKDAVGKVQSEMDIDRYMAGEPIFSRNIDRGLMGAYSGLMGAVDVGAKNIFGTSPISESVAYENQLLNQAIEQKNIETFSKPFEMLGFGPGVQQSAGEVGKFTGDVITGIAQMIPAIVGTVATKNPNVGMSIMGISAGGNASQQALQAGATPQQALLHGTVVGLAESMIERLGFIPGGEVVVKGLTNTAKQNLKRIMLTNASKILGEGFEEALMVPIENASARFTYGQEGPIFNFEEMGYNALVGMGVGGGFTVMNLPSEIQKSQEAIQNINDRMNELASFSIVLPQDSKTRQIIEASIANNMNITYEDYETMNKLFMNEMESMARQADGELQTIDPFQGMSDFSRQGQPYVEEAPLEIPDFMQLQTDVMSQPEFTFESTEEAPLETPEFMQPSTEIMQQPQFTFEGQAEEAPISETKEETDVKIFDLVKEFKKDIEIPLSADNALNQTVAKYHREGKSKEDILKIVKDKAVNAIDGFVLNNNELKTKYSRILDVDSIYNKFTNDIAKEFYNRIVGKETDVIPYDIGDTVLLNDGTMGRIIGDSTSNGETLIKVKPEEGSAKIHSLDKIKDVINKEQTEPTQDVAKDDIIEEKEEKPSTQKEPDTQKQPVKNTSRLYTPDVELEPGDFVYDGAKELEITTVEDDSVIAKTDYGREIKLNKKDIRFYKKGQKPSTEQEPAPKKQEIKEEPKSPVEDKIDKLTEQVEKLVDVVAKGSEPDADKGTDTGRDKTKQEQPKTTTTEKEDGPVDREGGEPVSERDTADEGRVGQRRDDEGVDIATKDEPTRSDDAGKKAPDSKRTSEQLKQSENKGQNIRITKDTKLFEGGQKTKFRNNIKALELLNKLDEEGRLATPEEQEILVKYVGWGGLSEVFDKAEWSKEREKLQNVVSKEQYSEIRRTVNTAFYTDPVVIDSIYNALDQLGFEGGKILEPSAGVGHFLGMVPDKFSKSQFMAVEKDETTGKILKNLYQNSNVHVKGFEDVTIPNNYFDVVVGNVPFGNIKISDTNYSDKLTSKIHNYFFVKSLDKVREGGLVALITSTNTMNGTESLNQYIRNYIDNRADFLGAIRLPNSAFKGANTQVVSDIIFLRKKTKGITAEPINWVDVNDNQKVDGESYPIRDNEYYIKNRNMVIGKISRDWRSGINVEYKGNLSNAIQKRIELLPRDMMTKFEGVVKELNTQDQIEELNKMKDNEIIVKDDSVYQKQGEQLVELPLAKTNRSKRLAFYKEYVGLKKELKKLLTAQHNNIDDAGLSKLQDKLSKDYDSFVKNHGNLHNNIKLFKGDPESYSLLALEIAKKKYKMQGKNKVSYYEVEKSEVFNVRTINNYTIPAQANNPMEAMAVSKITKNKLDMDYVAELLNTTKEDAIKKLEGQIYKNPEADWEIKQDYLSGDVKQKLRVAKDYAAIDKQFEKNVKALEEVIPKDKPIEKIELTFGASFIPQDVYEDFIMDLLKADRYDMDNINVKYDHREGMWNFNYKQYLFTEENRTIYAVGRRSGLEVVYETLRGKTIVVNTDGKRDVKKTKEAFMKQERIRREFTDFIIKNKKIANKVQRIFNDTNNRYVPPKQDEKDRVFPNMNPNIKLRPHQIGAVNRILNNGNTLLAHQVGFGKSFIFVVANMELKRLGVAKKPLMAVPKNKVDDFASDFKKLYPSSKVLVLDSDALSKTAIKKTFNLIMTNNWDSVIMSHENLQKLPMSESLIKEYFESQKSNMREVIALMQAEKADSKRIKDVEKSLENLEVELKKMLSKHDKSLPNFEELGLDFMFVDESHLFKNLRIISKRKDVKGISSAGSMRADDLYMKTRYLNNRSNHKSIVFATGTPVSNYPSEMHTLFKYLREDILEQTGLVPFDAWLNTFGEISTASEVGIDGVFKPTERFRNYVNLQTLMGQYREFADIQMDNRTIGLKIPDLKEGEPITIESEASPEFEEFANNLIDRMKNVGKGPGKESALKVAGDARKATVDMRLIDNTLPDYPDSKANKTVENIINHYKELNDVKGTQLVFLAQRRAYESLKTEDGGYKQGKLLFDVYEDMIPKLVKGGIKREEIAVYDEIKEGDLENFFEDFNSGKIRVLLASYKKASTGINVQERLGVIHEMDSEYRPSDIEQAEGRMLRQGNKFYDMKKNVTIYRYVTAGKGSYDVSMWQMLSTKMKNFQAMYTGDLEKLEVDVDDPKIQIANTLLAQATGDPLIMKKIEIEDKISTLNVERTAHNRDQQSVKDNVESAKVSKDISIDNIARLEQEIALNKDMSAKNFNIRLEGKNITDRTEAGKIIKSYDDKTKGKYTFDFGGHKVTISPETNTMGENYIIEFNFSGVKTEAGYIDRLNNIVKNFDKILTVENNKLKSYEKLIESNKNFVEQEYPKQKELEQLTRELSEINSKLKIADINQIEFEDDAAAGPPVKALTSMTTKLQGPKLGPATGKNVSGVAKKQSDIVKDFAEKFSIKVQKKLLHRRKSVGEFNTMTHVIGLRKANDIPTLAHELGHYIDQLFKLYKTKQVSVSGELAEIEDTLPKGYKKKELREEAIAEYFRLYLTDELTELNYPNITDFIRGSLNKQMMKDIDQLKQDIWDLTNLDPMKRIEHQTQFVTDKPRKGKFDLVRTMRQFYQGAVYSSYGIEWAAKQTKKPMFAKHIQDSLAELRGYEGISQYDINATGEEGYFQTDLFGEKVGDSYYNILKPIHESEEKRRAFWVYSIARRAEDYESRGLELPDTFDTYKDVVNAVESNEKKYPDFKEMFEEAVEYRKKNLQLLVQGGVYSQESVNKMLKDNPNYIPMKRIVDYVRATTGSGGDLGSSKKTVKRLKGGGEDIEDPEVWDINNTYIHRSVALRNKVLLDFVKEFDPQLNKNITKGLGKLVNRAKFQLEQIKGDLVKSGVDVEEMDLETMARIYTPNYLAGDNQIVVYDKGKPIIYDVDPDLYQAISRINPTNLGVLKKVVDALAYVANISRAGTIFTPKFMTNNMARDIVGTAVYSKYGLNPLDFAKGFYSAFTEDEFYKIAKRRGGTTNVFSAEDRKFAKEDMMKMMAGRSKADKLLFKLKHPIMTLHDFTEPFEMGSKIAVLRKIMQHEGASEETIRKAITGMRDANVDFRRMGSWVKDLQLNRVSMFLNSGIQGLDKTVRTFANKETRKGAIFRSITYVTIPTLLLYMVNKDDEDYLELPWWRRDYFWNVKIPGTKYFIPIPKPFDLGIIFGAIPERMLASAYEDNAFKDLGDTMKQTFIPNMEVTALRPFYELATNKNWLGKPILSYSDLNKLPKDQFNEYTSKLSMGIVKVTGDMEFLPEFMRSPKQLDFLIKSYTSTIGRGVLNTIDSYFEGRVLSPREVIIKNFLVDASRNPKSVSDFFEIKEQLRKTYKKGMTNMALNKVYNAMYKEIDSLMDMKKELQDTDTKEAKDTVEKIKKLILELTRQANTLYEKSKDKLKK